MKKIKSLLNLTILPLLLIFPAVVSAETSPDAFNADGGDFGEFLNNILIFLNNVLIPFILGIGFLIFVWGMFTYFIAGGADEEKRGKGKSLIIWTILAFVIIIVFWGVINLIGQGTGLGGQSLNNDILPGAVEINNSGTNDSVNSGGGL